MMEFEEKALEMFRTLTKDIETFSENHKAIGKYISALAVEAKIDSSQFREDNPNAQIESTDDDLWQRTINITANFLTMLRAGIRINIGPQMDELECIMNIGIEDEIAFDQRVNQISKATASTFNFMLAKMVAVEEELTEQSAKVIVERENFRSLLNKNPVLLGMASARCYVLEALARHAAIFRSLPTEQKEKAVKTARELFMHELFEANRPAGRYIHPDPTPSGMRQ